MMLLTEEEAKTKICPQLLRRKTDGTLTEPHPVKCIASDCMMWRGALQRKSDGLIVAHKLRVDARDYESVGCCGLAGKPEVT